MLNPRQFLTGGTLLSWLVAVASMSACSTGSGSPPGSSKGGSTATSTTHEGGAAGDTASSAAGGSSGETSGGTSSEAGAASATGGASAAGGSRASTTIAHSGTGRWQIMPLGDSITGSTCYVQFVSKLLIDAGHTNFAFVGTVMNNQGCTGAKQVKCEGHGGYGVTYLPQNTTRTPFPCTKQTQGCGSYAELQTWAAEKPDVVLMHYGTNDVWDGQSTSNILSAYLAVVAEFRAQNPNVIFFISKIIKLNPSGCGGCLTGVKALADALTESWATTNSTATSPILIVDHYDSGFDPAISSDTADGVHPSPRGANKMATVSKNALLVLDQI